MLCSLMFIYLILLLLLLKKNKKQKHLPWFQIAQEGLGGTIILFSVIH